MYVYIRVYTLLVYIHVYIGQNQVYITTLLIILTHLEQTKPDYECSILLSEKITTHHFKAGGA